MVEFIKTFWGMVLITAAIVLILMLWTGIQYVMLRYGSEIVIGAFLAFVGWIAYGAYKSKK